MPHRSRKSDESKKEGMTLSSKGRLINRRLGHQAQYHGELTQKMVQRFKRRRRIIERAEDGVRRSHPQSRQKCFSDAEWRPGRDSVELGAA
jgi:hypothetical protein